MGPWILRVMGDIRTISMLAWRFSKSVPSEKEEDSEEGYRTNTGMHRAKALWIRDVCRKP